MFAGFTDRDFDSYAPNKWKSNVFNRERLEVKQKLLALGRELGGALIAADGSPLACEASSEHPALWNHKQVEAQHLFFSRNEAARKELDLIMDRARPMSSMLEDPTPQRNHLFLCATVDLERIEFSLKLHPDARVDRQNFERKLAEPWECEKFLDLVHALPEDLRIGVSGSLSQEARALDNASLKGVLLDFAKPELPGNAHWFVVGKTIPRNDAKSRGVELAATAREELLRLLPLYQFVAWSRDNDFVSMREALKQEKQTRRQKGLLKNDRVRIVRGVFAGRQGIVQELDAKGALKVTVGLMAVKVDADDVEKI